MITQAAYFCLAAPIHARLLSPLAHTHTHTHTSLFTPFHHTPPQVPLHLVPPSLCHPPVPGQLDEVGVLEISKEATVEDLKITILTLPAVSQSCDSHVKRILSVL